MPREGLDVNVVSYKYEGMRQKEETNLVLGDVEVEVDAGDLGLDDVVPEPVQYMMYWLWNDIVKPMMGVP